MTYKVTKTRSSICRLLQPDPPLQRVLWLSCTCQLDRTSISKYLPVYDIDNEVNSLDMVVWIVVPPEGVIVGLSVAIPVGQNFKTPCVKLISVEKQVNKSCHGLCSRLSLLGKMFALKIFFFQLRYHRIRLCFPMCLSVRFHYSLSVVIISVGIKVAHSSDQLPKLAISHDDVAQTVQKKRVYIQTNNF